MKKVRSVPRVNNNSFYKKAIKKYGATAEGVHWNSEYTQRIRFEVITSLLGDDIKNATIADAGCGFGHFYDYLEENAKVPKRYIGLELHDMMIQHAKSRGLEVYKCDVLRDGLPEVDYYVASGSLNLLHPFETHLFIRRMLQYAKKGVVFNMLKGVSTRGNAYNKYEPEKLIEELNLKTEEIQLVEDYLEESDFTIFISSLF